jgi:hypothetical protein
LDALNVLRTVLRVNFAELQPRYHLVYLYVLRSLGTCFTFDDLLDFDQV